MGLSPTLQTSTSSAGCQPSVSSRPQGPCYVVSDSGPDDRTLHRPSDCETVTTTPNTVLDVDSDEGYWHSRLSDKTPASETVLTPLTTGQRREPGRVGSLSDSACTEGPTGVRRTEWSAREKVTRSWGVSEVTSVVPLGCSLGRTVEGVGVGVQVSFTRDLVPDSSRHPGRQDPST